MARRLMLAHPAATHATDIAPTCPNVSAAKGSARAESMHTSFIALYAKVGVASTNDTPHLLDA